MHPAVKAYLRERARIAGRAKSEKKAASSRRNGLLGGRPKRLRNQKVLEYRTSAGPWNSMICDVMELWRDVQEVFRNDQDRVAGENGMLLATSDQYIRITTQDGAALDAFNTARSSVAIVELRAAIKRSLVYSGHVLEVSDRTVTFTMRQL
jgi:hypothetical protein